MKRFRSLVIAVLGTLAAASPAAAQPVTSPCHVGVSRAPDEVRAAIAHWISAEPRCATSLEVRVVATDGGYYVIAHSGQGRVFERVVPDAQAVGVLVASWAADDTAPAPVPAPAPVATPAPAPAAAILPPSLVAPRIAAAPVTVEPKDGGPVAAPVTERRWLAIGAMSQIDVGETDSLATGSRGVRADLDVLRRGKWAVGVGLALLQTNLVMYDGYEAYNYIETDDVRAMASLAYTHRRGKWALRATGGVGIIYTAGSGSFDFMAVEASGAFPTVEATLVVTRDLSANWGVLAGPAVNAYQQEYVFAAGDGATTTYRRGQELSLYAALLRRL